jgi:hypothetical protein
MAATDIDPDDPYAPQIAAIRAKLAQPPASGLAPAIIAARRAENDRQYELGMLGILSGNEAFGNVGGMLAKQAMAGRTPTITERGTVDPLSGAFTYNPAYQSERDAAQLGGLLQALAAAAERRQTARQSAMDRRETALMTANIMAGNAAGQRAQARDDRLAQQTDKETQDFSKRAETLTPLLHAAGDVQKMLDDYADKSIPGVGYDSLMGPMLSREGVVNRSKVQSVANALLRAQSGQAVSLSEEARAAAQTLSSGRYSEKEFREGWPQIVGSLNDQVANIRAGFNPQAVATFAARGGNFAPVAGATAAPADDGSAVDFSALPSRGGPAQKRKPASGGASGDW